ncbi:MAG TPA: hypothetical protein VHD83_05785 [Puia sp.]|nr:hypothetical protein [Puia sp.]
MPIPEFSQAQYLRTMISPMTNVTDTADASVDIWPIVRELSNMNLIPALVAERHLIEAVYRNKTGTYDHVLLPTSQSNTFICIIVNNNKKEVEGYYILDLEKEYSLVGSRITPGTIEQAMTWGNDEMRTIIGVRHPKVKRSPWWKFWR